MPEIRKILFPVDFSEQSKCAAPHVMSLAGHFAAGVTLLHAIQIPGELDLIQGTEGGDAFRSALRHSACASIHALMAHAPACGPVRAMIEEGDPAEIILKTAEVEGADLIMMPTHGLGLLRHFLIGSVTAKVLHDAECPVWTSVHTDQPCGNPGVVRTVLCAVDNGPSSVPLIQWAAWLACRYGAEFKLVHVIPAINETSRNPGELEIRRYLCGKARDEFAAWTNDAGIDAEVQFRGGEIAPKVSDTAIQLRADLLVIGRDHLPSTLGRLRTESLAIIREAPCPVISV